MNRDPITSEMCGAPKSCPQIGSPVLTREPGKSLYFCEPLKLARVSECCEVGWLSSQRRVWGQLWEILSANWCTGHLSLVVLSSTQKVTNQRLKPLVISLWNGSLRVLVEGRPCGTCSKGGGDMLVGQSEVALGPTPWDSIMSPQAAETGFLPKDVFERCQSSAFVQSSVWFYCCNLANLSKTFLHPLPIV